MIKMKLTIKQKDALVGYLFILPFIIGFIFLFLNPLITSLLFSFSKVQAGVNGAITQGVGWENYHRAFFVDPRLNRILFDTIKDVLINSPGILIFSFIIASILNTKFRGRTAARAILFLPVVITSGAILSAQGSTLANVVAQRMSSDMSLFNDLSRFLLSSIKVDTRILQYVIGMVSRVYIIIKSSGVQILLFLAGLQTISPSLFEASSIEGATAWENFWKISMPMVSPYFLVCAVFTVIFESLNASNWMMQTITYTSLGAHDFGYGAALGWIYLVFIAIFTGFTILLISKAVFYHD